MAKIWFWWAPRYLFAISFYVLATWMRSCQQRSRLSNNFANWSEAARRLQARFLLCRTKVALHGFVSYRNLQVTDLEPCGFNSVTNHDNERYISWIQDSQIHFSGALGTDWNNECTHVTSFWKADNPDPQTSALKLRMSPMVVVAILSVLALSGSLASVSAATSYNETCAKIASAISPSSQVYYPGSPHYNTDMAHYMVSSTQKAACSVEPGTTADVGVIVRVFCHLLCH